MSPQLCFFLSIAFGLIAWSRHRPVYLAGTPPPAKGRSFATSSYLVLHSSRFIGLAFLVPGVVSPDLPSAVDGRLLAGWSATPTFPLNAIAQ